MSRARQVAAFAVAESIARGASWLMLFVLPWLLSPAEYGIVVLLVSFESVAAGVLILGQDRATMWRAATIRSVGEGRPSFVAAVQITVAASLLAFLVVALLSATGRDHVLNVPLWPHLWLLLATLISMNVNRIALAFARVAALSAEFVRYRVLTGVGRLACTLGLAGLTGSSIAYPAGGVLGVVAGGGRLWFRLARRAEGEPAAEESPRAEMIRYGAPLSLHALGINAGAFVDRWVIGAMLGLAVVGAYGWYYMLGSAVTFVYAALSVYYEPAIYRECRTTGSAGRLREYLGISLIAAGVYSLIGTAAAPLLSGFVPETLQAEPKVTRVVLIAHWLYPLYLAGNYLLSAFGRTGRVALLSIVPLAVVLPLNLVLVPRIGAIGGAWATLAGTTTLVLAVTVMLNRVRLGATLLVGPAAVVVLLGLLGLLTPGLGGLALASMGLIGYGVAYTRWASHRDDPIQS